MFCLSNQTATAAVNLHLANLNYRICFATQENYCTINWTAYTTATVNPFAFVMTGAAAASASFMGEHVKLFSQHQLTSTTKLNKITKIY